MKRTVCKAKSFLYKEYTSPEGIFLNVWSNPNTGVFVKKPGFWIKPCSHWLKFFDRFMNGPMRARFYLKALVFDEHRCWGWTRRLGMSPLEFLFWCLEIWKVIDRNFDKWENVIIIKLIIFKLFNISLYI